MNVTGVFLADLLLSHRPATVILARSMCCEPSLAPVICGVPAGIFRCAVGTVSAYKPASSTAETVARRDA